MQELQNEVNCMNDSRDFQDAESVRSGHSHVTSHPVSFPPHPIPDGMLRHSFVTPSRREGPPSIWDTHGISGNVFANPDASSSAPYPQELHQWNSSMARRMGSPTGGGGLARVPNLRVCNLLSIEVAHAGSPWYRLVGVSIPPVSREGGRARLPKKSKLPPRGTGMTVLTYPCPSQPCFGGSKGCARVTGKGGENGQNSGSGRALKMDKTVGSQVR